MINSSIVAIIIVSYERECESKSEWNKELARVPRVRLCRKQKEIGIRRSKHCSQYRPHLAVPIAFPKVYFYMPIAVLTRLDNGNYVILRVGSFFILWSHSKSLGLVSFESNGA